MIWKECLWILFSSFERGRLFREKESQTFQGEIIDYDAMTLTCTQNASRAKVFQNYFKLIAIQSKQLENEKSQRTKWKVETDEFSISSVIRQCSYINSINNKCWLSSLIKNIGHFRVISQFGNRSSWWCLAGSGAISLVNGPCSQRMLDANAALFLMDQV